jgi:hypothetical protein
VARHITATLKKGTIERWERERELLDFLYKKFTVGQEARQISAERIAKEAGQQRAAVDAAIRSFDKLGILSRRLEFGGAGPTGHIGRQYHWTLLVPKAEAVLRLSNQQEMEREAIESGRPLYSFLPNRSGPTRKNTKASADAAEQQGANGYDPEKVVVAPETSEEETKAVVGEERPSPFAALAPLRKLDDAEALIEAARQYRNRKATISATIEQTVKAMASIGVTFDREAFEQTLTIETDEALELVAQLIPHVDALQNRIGAQQEQINALKAKAAETGRLEAEVATLRTQNQRLISRSVGATN